jgi:hypothetical protein
VDDHRHRRREDDGDGSDKGPSERGVRGERVTPPSRGAANTSLSPFFVPPLALPARRDELGQIGRSNSNGIVNADVGEVFVLAEFVDGPRPDGELLGDLGDAK